jgi:hypothetical protein
VDPDRIPDVDRGSGRPLSERAARMAARAALTDRRSRFRTRLVEVRAAEARRRRRERWVERLIVTALLVGAPLAGGWAAPFVGATVGVGAAVGLVAAVGILAARAIARRRALGRGARSWDWTTRRHVSYGDPSRRVQDMTGAAARRPGDPRRR